MVTVMKPDLTRRSALALTGAGLLASCLENRAFSGPANGLSRGAWTTGVALPEAVQEIYPCAHAGAIHLAGGFIARAGRITGPTSAHWRWTPGDTAWLALPELPAPRHHPQLVSFAGELFAFAGFESASAGAGWVMQPTGWRLTEQIQVARPLTPQDVAWQPAPALPVPCGEAVLGVTGDGALHLAGGRTPSGEANATWTDHADTDHHFVLTDPYGSWQEAAPCLSRRNSAAGDVIDGNLHIVGGRTVSGGNVAAHEVYDSREDRWRTAAPMPQAQGGLAAAALGGKLYAFGGEFFGNGGGVYAQAWAYDPATDAWEALPDMPSPRHGLGALALDDRIHVIGGALEAGGNATSAVVDVFVP